MRKFVLLLLLALAFSVLVPATFAQDATETFCGDLAAEDCDILTQASAAEANSGSADFNLQIDIAGIPDMGVDTLNINLAGDAAYSLDADAIESLTMDEGTEMTAEESLAAFTTLLSSFDGELNLTLTLPEELTSDPSVGLPSNVIPLNLALVDGVGYINFDSLNDLTGGMLSQQGLEGWGGINFIDLVTQLAAENPDMLSQLDMATTTTEMTDMSQFESFEQYVTLSRGEDVDGQAVFVTDIDFGGLVNDPAFQDVLEESMATSGQTMSDADMQQALGLVQIVAQQSTLSVSQRIDPATGFTTGGEFNMNIDLTSLVAASGEATEGDAFISIVGTIDYSGINETTVEAPADASIAPSEQVLQMLGGMGGMSN